jgi:hypothetical protein
MIFYIGESILFDKSGHFSEGKGGLGEEGKYETKMENVPRSQKKEFTCSARHLGLHWKWTVRLMIKFSQK